MTATKLTPLTRKHHPSPSAAIATPAIAGPSNAPPIASVELKATALARFSRPTISTTKDCRVGPSTALMVPSNVASTRTCAIRTWPLNVSPASANASTIADDCVQTRTVRRR
jgi:hypothetical protein